MKYFVEAYRPPYPSKARLAYQVHTEKEFCWDILSPDLTALFCVRNVTTKAQALAALIEYAAGLGTSVYQVLPKPKGQENNGH